MILHFAPLLPPFIHIPRWPPNLKILKNVMQITDFNTLLHTRKSLKTPEAASRDEQVRIQYATLEFFSTLPNTLKKHFETKCLHKGLAKHYQEHDINNIKKLI